jgi:predicted porin
MRELLLAGAAAVGLGGAAAAQTAVPANTSAPMGVMGSPSPPVPYLGGNNPNVAEGTAPTGPTAPVPGSAVIHLNGRIWFGVAMEGSSADHVGANKLAPLMFAGLARLYPGVDAMAANGLRYGGIVEIRQNFSPTGSISGSTASSGASGYSCASTLFFRREAVYLGSNTVGIFRLGQDDGPISQFDAGITTFQNFDINQAWESDAINSIPTNAQPTFPFWSGVGNEYAISKAVYLSPQFYGFDLGVSYAPNVTANIADNQCTAAAPGCVALVTSSAAIDSFRPRNMVEIEGRYRGNLSGLGIYALGGYVSSGVVHNGGGPDLANGFSVGDTGLALTYAGVTIGGHLQIGAYNGQVALQPKGGAHAIAWMVGAQYATGPLTMGTSYFNYQSQGSPALVGISQRHENGVAVGGSYAIAPGLVGFVSYLYGDRQQGGFNFVTNAVGSADNNAHSQMLLLGTRVQW